MLAQMISMNFVHRQISSNIKDDERQGYTRTANNPGKQKMRTPAKESSYNVEVVFPLVFFTLERLILCSSRICSKEVSYWNSRSATSRSSCIVRSSQAFADLFLLKVSLPFSLCTCLSFLRHLSLQMLCQNLLVFSCAASCSR